MREELLDRLLTETENETNSNKSTDYKINFIEKMKKTFICLYSPVQFPRNVWASVRTPAFLSRLFPTGEFMKKIHRRYFYQCFDMHSFKWIVFALALIATGIFIMFEVFPSRKIECMKPEIGNGFIVGNDYTFHGKISFHCQEGYKMWSGNKSIEEEKSYNLACTIYGTWNGTIPTCKIINCDTPVPPSNGYIIGSNYNYGQNISFGCSTGYRMWTADGMAELKETPILFCNRNSKWSGEIPVCKVINCDIPVPPSNGYIIGSNYNYGQNISFGCSTGYRLWTADGMTELQETPILFCNKNSKWSGEIPVCKVINCETPVTPINGYIVGSTYTYGQNITFGCSHPYKMWTADEMTELKEAPILFCNENGEWTGKIPVCKASECESLAQGLNTRFIKYSSPHHHGDIVEYECSKGYHLERGDLRRHCRKDGSWTGSEPACRAIKCRIIERGYNARLIYYNPPHHYGDTVFYECFEGYSIESGNGRRTCMEDGTWTGSQLECRRDRTEYIHDSPVIHEHLPRNESSNMKIGLYVSGFIVVILFFICCVCRICTMCSSD